MSVSRWYDIHCDVCLIWTHGGHKLTEARRLAKSRGWKRRDGRDLCPKCAATGGEDDNAA